MSRLTNDYGTGLAQIGGTGYLLRTPSEQNLNGGGKGLTPTRPRLIGASELNGTPISLARKGERMASPLLARLNKENQQTNACQPSPGKLAIKIKPTATMGDMGDNRTKSPLTRDKPPLGSNLSPFNKMSEGLKSYMQYGTLPAAEPSEKYQTLGGRIEMERHASAAEPQEDVLKTSNSFKLLGSRKNSLAALSPLSALKDKSPTHNQKKLKNEVIDDIIKNCGRKQQQQLMKTSNGSSPFLGFGKQLTDSKSYGKFDSNKFKNAIRESTNHENFLAAKEEDAGGMLMCLNKDGKTAKYRVVNNNPDDDDEEPMYYCSNCAIQLIQQGFKVEEIGDVGYNQVPEGNPLLGRVAELMDRITVKRDRMKKSKDSYTQLFQKDLNQIDSYYDSLISTIEELRVKERETILHHRDTAQQSADEQLNQLQSAVSRLSQLQSDLKRKSDTYRVETEIRHFSGFLEQQERPFIKTIQVEERVQDRFDNFVNSLYQQFTLKIEQTGRHEQPMQPLQQLYKQQSFGQTLNQQSGKAVNFSFEKNKPRAAKKLDALQPYIKQQSEVEDKNDSQQKERKPFRNLFPDESEHSDSQLCQQNLMSNDQDRPEQHGGLDCYSPSFKNM